MNAMRRGLDIEKIEAAQKRAAHKALHGTREERSGRFMLEARYGKSNDAQESSPSQATHDGDAPKRPAK
jgi:hypothetical protein